MRLPLSAAVITLAALAAISIRAEAAPPTSLTVQIQGVRDKPGLLLCAVFREPRGFPAESAFAPHLGVATGSGETRTCTFDAIAPGRWAVSVLHDENGNYRLDTNAFGVPTEGWGTSRNVTHATRAPSFEESAVDLPSGKQTVSLNLHY